MKLRAITPLNKIGERMMKCKPLVITLLAGLMLAPWSGIVFADSADAECVVHERGEKKKGQSGPCLFSQRSGFVDIRLNNGKSYSLSPQQDKADVYKDQDGKRVKRSMDGDGTHTYKWEHKNVKVKFK